MSITKPSRAPGKRLTALACVLLFAWSAAGLGVDEDDLLPADEAFAISAAASTRESVEVTWQVADGYYLYRHQIRFLAADDAVVLGEPILPKGKEKEDEFFGRVETYRGAVTAIVPIASLPQDAVSIQLKARSQGCADLGVCYPPHQQILDIPLPQAGQSVALGLNLGPGLARDKLNLSGNALPFEGEVFQVDDAFVFEAIANSPDEILARWTIAPGHYVYREQFEFSASEPILATRLPAGVAKTDEHFGDVEVYYDQIEVPVKLRRANGAPAEAVTLSVRYQGCKEDGICYPPVERSLSIDMPAMGNLQPADSAALTEAVTDGPSPEAVAPVAEQDQLAAALSDGGLLWTLLTFVGLGLLLAFTPCVFPMIPILSGIIAGEGPQVTTRRAFTLSLVYVLAMALTYTLAGVIAGLFGANLQAAFQKSWVIASFSALFVGLALSMFGFYELQLPARWQSKLTDVSNRQSGGSVAGAAIMGLLSALIVGPCVAPPLAGALIYIGQTGDALIGGLALFALSLGMGIPLLAIGTSAGRFLPSAGRWMDAVKAVFGVALLALAIWMLERILPPTIIMVLWGALLISSGVYLGAMEPVGANAEGAPTGWRKLWKSFGVICLFVGALELIGAAAGGQDWLRPLAGLGSTTGQSSNQVPVTKIKSLTDLNAALKVAADQDKPALLDFYADWCVDCKRMDKYSFPDSQVQSALANGLMLKADVTANDEIDQALMRRFGIIGPPAILFFDASGQELRAYRVVGYQKPKRFAHHISQAFVAKAQ